MTNNSIQVMEEKYREELEAKDRQIQELKEEMEKMKAKYKRREEILESLYALKEGRGLDSGYYMGVSDSSRDICHRNESILSRDDLTEDLHAILEKEMAAEEERVLKLQASKQKEELRYNVLMKPLLDELYALE